MMNAFLLSTDAADQIRMALDEQRVSAVRAEDRLAAFRGGQLDVREGIAHIDVSGALVFEQNLLTRFIAAILGGTLYADLQQSIKRAAEDPRVQGILLRVNSPGGSVSGTETTAQLLREAAKTKPVVAYVESQAASAAYWLSSAATKIVAAGQTVTVGSIGVVAVMKDGTERDAKSGVKTYQFVSSQSPKKRPDLATDEGKMQLQDFVDSLAQVFIEAVAQNRGVDAKRVQTEFGQGDILPANRALPLGMIDQIGTEAEALALLGQMARSHGPQSAAKSKHAGGSMHQPNAEGAQPTVNEAAIRSQAHQSERARIAAILNHEEASGREPLARHLALETDLGAEAAVGILKTSLKAGTPFAGMMAGVKNPDVKPGVGAENPQAEVDAEVRRILALSGHKEANN